MNRPLTHIFEVNEMGSKEFSLRGLKEKKRSGQRDCSQLSDVSS